MSRPPRRIAVVGAGLAGFRAVEALRRGGHDGWLGLFGDEDELPYDRPALSKEVLTDLDGPISTQFRGAERLEQQGVEVHVGTGATHLDLASSTIEAGGSSFGFDGLLIATGAAARTLPRIAGFARVHTLRTRRDALAVRSELERARSLVVVGAGFIGAEVAASARSRGLEVTIVEMERAPLARVLGPQLGSATNRLHEEHGTKLRFGTAVVGGEEAPDGTVRLQLSDGAVLEADLVVIGIGVEPNTGWLERSGVSLANGIVCDASLNAGHAEVFAAGDVVNWPNPLFERRMRVEHWTNAGGQARHAAKNLLRGERQPFEGSNYFWSDQYGVRLQFAGVATPEVRIIDGAVEDRRFVAWFTEGERLMGAFSLDSPELLMKTKRAIEERQGWRDALRAMEEELAPLLGEAE